VKNSEFFFVNFKAEFGKEIHALSSAIKPYASSLTQSCVQECREACGGYGYLKVNRLGYLRECNDPILTFEGDNNVLIQQTSNHLISTFDEFLTTKSVAATPLGTCHFLTRFDEIMQFKFEATSREQLLTKSSMSSAFYLLRSCLCFEISSLVFERYFTNV
jgi:acyl-CoA oxidase